MAVVETDNLISLTEASKRGLSALVRDAEDGADQIVMRNNRAVAAVISIQRLEQLQRLEEDLADLSLATARMLLASDERTDLDDVLAEFGVSRTDLTDPD